MIWNMLLLNTHRSVNHWKLLMERQQEKRWRQSCSMKSSLIHLSSVSGPESVSMGAEQLQSFGIDFIRSGWAHIYLIEGGGRKTPLGGAVMTSSPLTAAIIRFWRVFLNMASAAWTGTRSEGEVCAGLAVPPPHADAGRRGVGVGEQEDVSAGW